MDSDDFPFGLNNQVVQPDGQIRVTIDIRNRSGREWPTAYLVLSSAYHPEKSHYRIDNWRVGETRSVDYVFPTAEVRERLAELRIENVSSVPVAESLSDIHQGSAGQSEESSGGMLGVWSGFKDAVGVPPPSPEDIAAASTASSPAAAEQVAKGTGIAINLEGLGDVDTTPLPTDGLSVLFKREGGQLLLLTVPGS